MDTEIDGSPYRLQHGNFFVGFTDPDVDFLVTEPGCCHFVAQIGEFFYVFFINHDRFDRSSVLPQNMGFLCVDFETNSFGRFAKTFSFSLSIMVFTGWKTDIVSIV